MDITEIAGIINSALLIFTLAMLGFVIISAAIGLLRSWKFSLIKLGRTVAAILLSFITVKIITAVVPMGELLAPIMGDLGGDLANTSPTLVALISNLPLAIIAPLALVLLFFVFNGLLMIPAIFVKKAILKDEYKAKEAKKALKILRKKKGSEACAPATADGEPTSNENGENAEEGSECALEADGSSAVVDPDEAAEIDGEALEADKEANTDEKPVDKEAALKSTIEKGKLTWGSRGISAGIKAVNAVIFIALLFMPIACLLTTVGDGMIAIKDAMVESGASLSGGEGEENSSSAVGGEDLTVICDEIIAPIVNNPVIAVSANPLYHAMYRNLTQVTVGDVTCYLDEELADIFELVGSAAYLLVDVEDYAEPQKKAINTVVGYVADSEFRSTIAAELFAAIGSAWQNGEAFLGIENPSSDEIAVIFDPLIQILAESDAESVEKDLHTFANIIGVFIDHKMFSVVTDTLESEDPLEGVRKITSSEFLADVLKEIYTNEDFKTMSQPVVKFTFNTLLSAIGGDPMGPGEYNDAPDLEGDEIQAEAEAICAIIDSALDFVDSMPEDTSDMGGLDIITQIDVAALGSFYDESQNSQILKDGFHDVFVALLSSDMFDDMRPVCDILIDHINNDPDLNMSNLLSATQELASLFIQYQGSNVATDAVKISATLTSLIQKVDTHTAEIIKEMLDSNAFGMDLLGESSGTGSQASKLLSSIVDIMASEEMKGLSEEEIQKEAKAIDYMLKIVNASSSSDGENSLNSVFESEEDNAEEMMETMLNSKLSTGAINAMAYDEEGNLTQEAKDMSANVTEDDRESVVNSAESYYKNNAGDMTEEEKETLQNNMNAIAAIFGSDLSDSFSDWDTELAQ